MAKRPGSVYQGPLFPRVESGSFVAPDKIAARITNMTTTSEGSLESVLGPAPYLPWTSLQGSAVGDFSAQLILDAGLSVDHNYFEDYMATHGIFHAVIENGTREILLLHCGKEIWSFEGWERGWRVILGPGKVVAGESTQTVVNYKTDGIVNDSTSQPPTQFEAAPNGVIIVPQGDRAYFYDGIVVAPLGYNKAPGAPQGLGPRSTSATPQSFKYTKKTGEAYFKNPWDTTNFKDEDKEHSDITVPLRNDGGYAHDAQRGFYDGFPDSKQETKQYWIAGNQLITGMHSAFGRCYVGTVMFPEGMSPLSIRTHAADNNETVAAIRTPGSVGLLLDGEYYAAVQWIDRWGNLSPVSQRSNMLRFDRQVSAGIQIIGNTGNYGKDTRRHNQVPGAGELVAKQVAWTGISPGPDATIGRILYRTRDVLNSGSNELLEVPPNASGGATAYATLPDNISTFYPDNVSDARLRNPAPDLSPVPKFTLCRIALGRLWIGGVEDAPGMIRPSLPGRWGTFPAGTEMFPDPSGGMITGLWSSPNGLLAFTSNSIYLVSSVGISFSTRALSTTIGCVAPSSLAEMPGGVLVWLAADGFYQMTSSEADPVPISVAIGNRLKNLNFARLQQATAAFDPMSGEYRCWVPIDGTSRNSVCFVYDGEGWRERTDMYDVTDVCVTRNHQSYMLTCGQASGTVQYLEGNSNEIKRTKWYGIGNSPKANGVWVLDHENHTWIPDTTYIVPSIETSWLGSGSSQQKKTVIRVYLWLRETQKPENKVTELTLKGGQVTQTPDLSLKVSVFTDWRMSRVVSDEVLTTPISYAPLYPEEDPPPAWEQEVWSTTTETWKRRRPFWAKVEVSVPSCEVFKLKLEPLAVSGTAYRFEFLGLAFDVIPRGASGTRMTKVTETL